LFKKATNIHFVGIGGIGMSGIAELLLNLKFKITGSDINQSQNVKRLERKGIKISLNHSANNIENVDVVVYSSAVKQNNPELIAAHNNNIPVIRRAEMLAELINLKETSIAVGGTHGKTTTSSMIGTVLDESGYDPTLVVGGLVSNLNSNVKLGFGDIIVVEADEYDRSFLALNPTIAVVTNLEMEHTDCYSNFEELETAFLQYCNSVPFYGEVILCADSPSLMKISQNIKKPVVTYGTSSSSDFRAINISYKAGKSIYNFLHKGKDLGQVKINAPGKHNILNSLAAMAIGIELNIPFANLKYGINNYKGVRRRFDIKENNSNIMVVDDYAHHPTEVNATINAAKSGWDKKIVTVFQPHLFTRTRDFYKEFAESLFQSNYIIISDIYAAREEPINGVSSQLIINELKRLGHQNIIYIKKLNTLNEALDNLRLDNHMVITMGAGDIWRFNEKYNNHLMNKKINI
jgi:UDP-N-acetylmuramate--alanine ligase